MTRVLLMAATTGYQTRAFGEAAARLGVDLVFATDRCDVLEDPWQDRAVPIRFFNEEGSVASILEAAQSMPFDGVLAVGDRPTVIAAKVLEKLGLSGHPADAAAIASHKQLMRERLREAGLPVPWFFALHPTSDVRSLSIALDYPCVVKPVGLSGSRGVMKADNAAEMVAAFERLQALLRSPEVRAERRDSDDMTLVEGFITGREYALEGLLHHGELHVLALFDKPDPLDGPFFEETIYVVPSLAPAAVQQAIAEMVTRAAAAIGLRHGPIHAECRVNDTGVYILEIAARPIGGLCSRALRFEKRGRETFPRLIEAREARPLFSLEELLLQHALGESPEGWTREARASGVMMIPIPRRGVLRGVEGVEAAREVPFVDDLRVTAKPDQLLVPLPEGASYLGFIFAHGDTPAAVEQTLRAAHARLAFVIDPEVPVLSRA